MPDQRWRSAAWCIAVCVMQVAALSALSAQTPKPPAPTVGSVQGVASTQDGSVRLPGAVIQMFDATGAQVAELLSGDDGTFTVPNLPPGTYRFVSSLMGFRTTEASVAIARGAPTLVALDMPLHDLSEHVDVRAPDAVGPTGDTIAPTSGVTAKELRSRFLPSGGPARCACSRR